MNHALIEASTQQQIAIATEAADWLIDAVATSTQDRRFLRGEPAYDDVIGEAIIANGFIACLRAMKAKEKADEPKICEDCGKNYADYNSNTCVGCDAYRDHQDE